jgi:hypothetical protein
MSVTGMYVPWRLAAAKPGESVRWENVDGRWVAISLAEGGRATVSASEHAAVTVDSYDAALTLAKKWRI